MNATDPFDDDAPTVPDLPIVTPPRRGTTAAPPRPYLPGPGGRPGANPAARILLIVLAVVVVLVAACTGAWGLIVRPALHQSVDTALRTQLDGFVDSYNALPQLSQLRGSSRSVSLSVTVQATDVTASIQQQAAQQSAIKNPQVTFANGRATLSFQAYGTDEAISTALSATNGKLLVAATRVDGPLAIVETGSELEATLNEALGRMRTDISFTQLTLHGGVMTVSLKSASPSGAS
jgi:hypothetical protein